MNRTKLIATASASLIAGGLFLAGVSTQAVQAAPSATSQPKKVTICHRTHATTNPYVRITVSESSIGGSANKHGGSKHNQSATNPTPSLNVYDPTKTYTPNQKKWGDIIPNVYTDGTPFTASGSSTNFTGLGLAIWNNTGSGANLCKAMSARDLYELEKSTGEVTEKEIQDDLDESGADEFSSALSACGGTTFVGCAATNLGAATATTTTSLPAGATTLPAGVTTTTALAGSQTLAAGTGGLQVNTWIDADRNGKKSGSEANLAGMSVTITGPNGETQTAKTNSSGIAQFLNLAPGSWKVVSVLSKAGYEKVYDSDGSVNWKSTLTVTEGKVVKASYAAASAKDVLPTTGATNAGLLAVVAALMLMAGAALLLVRRRPV